MGAISNGQAVQIDLGLGTPGQLELNFGGKAVVGVATNETLSSVEKIVPQIPVASGFRRESPIDKLADNYYKTLAIFNKQISDGNFNEANKTLLILVNSIKEFIFENGVNIEQAIQFLDSLVSLDKKISALDDKEEGVTKLKNTLTSSIDFLTNYIFLDFYISDKENKDKDSIESDVREVAKDFINNLGSRIKLLEGVESEIGENAYTCIGLMSKFIVSGDEKLGAIITRLLQESGNNEAFVKLCVSFLREILIISRKQGLPDSVKRILKIANELQTNITDGKLGRLVMNEIMGANFGRIN